MKVYRSPGRLWLHVWSPDRYGVVIGDRLTGVRFALSIRGRYRIVWRYAR